MIVGLDLGRIGPPNDAVSSVCPAGKTRTGCTEPHELATSIAAVNIPANIIICTVRSECIFHTALVVEFLLILLCLVCLQMLLYMLLFSYSLYFQTSSPTNQRHGLQHTCCLKCLALGFIAISEAALHCMNNHRLKGLVVSFGAQSVAQICHTRTVEAGF